MERIVNHEINKNPDHPTADVGENVYRVRWYGNRPEYDTFEPVRNLPRNKIVSYHRRKRLKMSGNIDEAMTR